MDAPDIRVDLRFRLTTVTGPLVLTLCVLSASVAWAQPPVYTYEISIVNGEARVEDLDSKNGTYVRGERLTASAALNDRDEIRLGSITLTFRSPPTGASTETRVS